MGADLRETLPGVLRARGMTQDELAALTGIRRTDINAIARGRIEVGPDRLRRIAEALSISVLELIPEAEPDETAFLLDHRLREAEDAVNAVTEETAKNRRAIGALQRRVRELEDRLERLDGGSAAESTR